jgi:hypothetical protein
MLADVGRTEPRLPNATASEAARAQCPQRALLNSLYASTQSKQFFFDRQETKPSQLIGFEF